MRVESLQSFKTLVEAGSYASAAEGLFMSPTTVHGHVKALEEELGVSLTTFTNRKLELTQAGSRLLRFAERVLAEQRDLRNDLAAVTPPNESELRIASLHGPSIHLLPPVIREFRRLHPEVRIRLSALGVGESLAALLRGEVTIAVLNEIHEDMATGGYAGTALYEDELVLIVRATDYEPPDLELLTRYPLAIQPPTSGYRQHLERWARRQQIPLRFVYEHSSFDGILSFVMDGECIGMVGRYVVEHGPMAPQLRVLDLPSFAIRRTVLALHARRIDTLSKHFIDVFRAHYGLATPEVDSENP